MCAREGEVIMSVFICLCINYYVYVVITADVCVSHIYVYMYVIVSLCNLQTGGRHYEHQPRCNIRVR